ncbi:YolD-like family protein [Sporosarcina sp. Te-1]|uniref:YolD-like family protein n=1 Tax=Sporosarcina sp. Te-1 TaxID=2818390 RepID=UPI001A9D3C0A|nr:YolD-like family protein [Sporosarcina sp. Te-1]QTD39546.1 YolD-like family protein [Sporosarcina sp. Te-1]
MKVKGDIKDRGNIKWTALMLPEHVRHLRDWQAEDELVPEPGLTEFDMESMQLELELAYKRQIDTMVTKQKEIIN